MSKNLIYLLIILLFSIVGMKAFFHPGLYTAHDIWHQVVRLYYYAQAINDGQFPPYWIGKLANNFGYPLFFFSYHLPWLVGIPFLKLGLDISATIKILFFISYISSGIIMYFFVYHLLKGRLAALLSAILYLFLPYHFLIILVGASMGIAFVFTFLPLILLGFHLIKEQSKFGPIFLALGISGVILSHIMHLIFLFPTIVLFFLWEFSQTKQRINFLKNTCVGLVVGILISSFYLIPATYYNQFTRAHQETGFAEVYKRNFINFNQLIYSKWGYGPIINNAKDGENSFQLGFAQWIAILTLIFLIIFKKLSKTHQGLSIYMLLAFLVNIFLMLDSSKFLWAYLVKFATVDFPFRLLLPATFSASLSAGIVLVNINKKLQGLFFIFLILVALYTNRNHLNVNLYTNFPLSTYLSLETEKTTNTFNEYLPIKADDKLLNKPWNEIVGENSSASNTKQSTNRLSFDLDIAKEGSVSIGQFDFPGQTLYLDNKLMAYSIDKEGRINFIAPPGTHKVEIKYQETSLIKISKIFSLIGVVILFFSLLRELKTFKRKS